MNAINAEFWVYGLFTRDDNVKGGKRYFYVGKTRRSIAARAREHIYRAARGHEDLYEHLRQLGEGTKVWEFEQLRHCVAGEHAQDAELAEVIRLLREGHDLCNMRYGDATHKAELIRMKNDLTIRSAADVRRVREAAEAREQLRRRVKARGELRRKELAAMLWDTGIPSVLECHLLRGVLVRRLAADGDVSIEPRRRLSDLVRYARSMRRSPTIAALRRKIAEAHPLPPFTRA